MLAGRQVTARAYFGKIDGRVQGGKPFGMLFRVLLEVLVTARAHFCEIDGWVMFGALYGGVFFSVKRAKQLK